MNEVDATDSARVAVIKEFSKEEYRDYVFKLEKENQTLKQATIELKKSNDFYRDSNNWDYGKEWSSLKEIQLYHAIIRPNSLERKMVEKGLSEKWDDFDIMPDKVELLGKQYKYLCAGKLARQTNQSQTVQEAYRICGVD